MNDTLAKLEETIRMRRAANAPDSYVASLGRNGRAKMAEKLGEEAVEAVIAAVQDDKPAMVGEAADLMFHLLVLLADMDLSMADVLAELERREGLSGITEKSSRGTS
ncbi:phosphoribosyl-ATP diphosphatase [Parasphingorhabdus halotolerans]|uniref:Phosphoribosyl-ATP pyrophosphatase n=1 Tax=Parasphingorhabdus halotolerans TaxID=2725558 RepID=A0A6H2DKB4_9SPHN|nr:phosphoribosyl-ATP diphosphatase [Parasphingorhabdus halotolerans]QJB68830.1 phosphoribosyl-ATP diphosphatase [Parasphingorhabdus halotolerans]